MKHKSSVLLCEMDDGTINIYVNGVAVFLNNNPTSTSIEKIANCEHNCDSVIAMIQRAKESIYLIEKVNNLK
jgi:hypothetical protein